MEESKRKRLAVLDVKSNNNATGNSSNMTAGSDFPGEDNWVIVKKQRVNILIPRLPSIERSVVPDREQGQVCEITSFDMINTPKIPLETPSIAKAHLGEKHDDGSMSCSPNLVTQSSPKVSADNAAAIPKPEKPDSRIMSAKDVANSLKAFPRNASFLKFHQTSPELFRPSMQSGLARVCNSSISTINLNLNYKMRAINLERNILNAGGLGRWLSSLGLEQFEEFFRAKNVNKYDLVNLSMKKLKDMGAHAVGPRRKLMHAIECLCQPYCYKPFHKQIL